MPRICICFLPNTVMTYAGNTTTGQPDLLAILDECRRGLSDAPLTFAQVLGRVRHAGFALTGMLLALPFLQPIPLGPFSIVAGLAFVVLGVQMLHGRATPWLPPRVLHKELQGKVWLGLFAFLGRLVRVVRRIARPRWAPLVRSTTAQRLIGVLFVINGLLLAAPLVFVPFGNVMPAVAIMLVCMADLEQDGVVAALAWLWTASVVVLLLAVAGGIALLLHG